jgi:hypothetical protein
MVAFAMVCLIVRPAMEVRSRLTASGFSCTCSVTEADPLWDELSASSRSEPPLAVAACCANKPLLDATSVTPDRDVM